MKNERTGKSVASLAGRILKVLEELPEGAEVLCVTKGGKFKVMKASEIKALAGSCLTQAPDKKKVKTK